MVNEITTAAGDVATFQSTAANQVQCINYTRADGTAIAAGGKVLQFVVGVPGSSNNIASSGTHYTNTYVTITPSATSSKVLILLDLGWQTEDGDNAGHTVKITDDDGTTWNWLSGSSGYANVMAGGGLVSHYTSEHHTILLSPSTTSSKTYKVYVQKHTATAVEYNNFANTRIYALEIGA